MNPPRTMKRATSGTQSEEDCLLGSETILSFEKDRSN
jgi:hypothetical protein